MKKTSYSLLATLWVAGLFAACSGFPGLGKPSPLASSQTGVQVRKIYEDGMQETLSAKDLQTTYKWNSYISDTMYTFASGQDSFLTVSFTPGNWIYAVHQVPLGWIDSIASGQDPHHCDFAVTYTSPVYGQETRHGNLSDFGSPAIKQGNRSNKLLDQLTALPESGSSPLLTNDCQGLSYSLEFSYPTGRPEGGTLETKKSLGNALTWEGRSITITNLENLLPLDAGNFNSQGFWETIQTFEWDTINSLKILENPWYGDLSRSPFPLQVQITLADGSKIDTIVLSDTSHIDGYFEDGMGVQYMLSAIQELNLKK
jgi:hypothetical protein